ncbi:MAG: tetratricopeptide repeat protein [Gemmatimonadaceae bacterium]|nr:tetratricopeptide repeat protein [Gemmatimonadaceae bacterium]
MLVIRSTTISSSLFAIVLALPLAAQQPKQCSVDEGTPSEVARAFLTISQVANPQGADPASLKKKLADAVQLLTGNPGKVENPVGHAYELGKLLVLWSEQPDVPLTTTRGALGFATNPQDTVSLPAAIDSAFTVVETAQPECATETDKWRSQKVWSNLVNKAVQELNAGSVDSAEKHATESLLLNRKAPYGNMVLAQVAQRRNQVDRAIDLFQRTIDIASTDTLYNEVKANSLLNLGNLARQAAAEDSTKASKYNPIALRAYQTLAADSTASAGYHIDGVNGVVNVELAMGDSAAVRAVYKGQLDNPSAFPFNDVIQAGVWATNVGDSVAATKLFHAAYEMNPYHRDALSNLALIEMKAQKYDTALVLLNRLKAVDPNGDNSRLFVFTYAGLAKKFADLNHSIVARYNKSKDAKLRKVLTDSAALTTDSNKVYTDLAVNTNLASDSLPVMVRFSQFSNVDNKVTLAGTINNRTDAAKTYTLKVDFLDNKGNVVASQQATVGPVAGHGSGPFSVTAAGVGITAFRYAPLDN